MLTALESMFAAIIEDDRAKVKTLLMANVDLAAECSTDADRFESKIMHYIYVGDTALHVAAAGYRVEIAGMLLAAGADASSSKNRRGAQPLHYAADGHMQSPSWNPRQQVATIRCLLKARADINAQDKNGATPLHRAVRTRCADAMKYLLESGADPKFTNKSGSTAFHLAVQNTGRGGSGADEARSAQREIIQEFIGRGVSPAIKDAKGKSVLEWTRSDWVRRILLDKKR
ncbi:MAG: ankyrin repeat domain-containing protein [Candidatus Sumerlaeota bacterium]